MDIPEGADFSDMPRAGCGRIVGYRSGGQWLLRDAAPVEHYATVKIGRRRLFVATGNRGGRWVRWYIVDEAAQKRLCGSTFR